jgi:hypothetical protein
VYNDYRWAERMYLLGTPENSLVMFANSANALKAQWINASLYPLIIG